MKLSDIFRNISTILSKPVSSVRYRNISEETINDQLDDIKWSLGMVIELFGLLSDQEQLKLYNQVKEELRVNVNLQSILGKQCISFIESIDKNLEGKARQFGFFKSLIITTQRLINTVDDLRSNTKEILNGKNGIMMGDAQISHGMLFGCIGTGMIFTDFCMFLIAIFSHVISKQRNPDIPKYMIEKVVKHGDVCIHLINQMTNSPTGIQVINIITNIRKRGTDFKLNSSDLVRSNFDNSVSANGGVFFAVLGFLIDGISSIGEHFVSFRHEYYEMMKERKKWLENHVANIRMSLENVDKNDPQYLKTLQIIVYYEDKIAKYEKKLEKYYGE